MATTTNYSWTTPDDTALVKDGAAAIRSLGSSIDTTTKALNPSTTLGDIEYRSATANTNTRLGIGTTGQVLTVNGGVPAWATASTGGMTLLASGNLSGTEVSLTSISQSYTDLIVMVFGFRPQSTNSLQMRINGNTSSNYSMISTAASTGQTFSNTFWILSETQSGSTSNSVVYVKIPQYTSTASWRTANGWNFTNDAGTTTNYRGSSRQFINNTTTAVSSIQLRVDGEIFQAGSYTLYGVK